MSASPKPRSVFSAVCRSNGIVLGRTRATVGSRFPRNIRLASAYSQSTPVTSFVRWIAAFLPTWRRRLAGRFERSAPVFGARLPAIFSRIRRDIRPGLFNFCRPLVAAGKPSFLPLVQACKQASGSITQTFSLSPVGVPSLLAAHESNVSKDLRHERQVACKG